MVRLRKGYFDRIYSLINLKDNKEVAAIYFQVSYPKMKSGNGPWRQVKEEWFVLRWDGKYLNHENFRSVDSAKRWAKHYLLISRSWAKWKKL